MRKTNLPLFQLLLLMLLAAAACNSTAAPAAAPTASPAAADTPTASEREPEPATPTATAFIMPTLPPSPTPICPGAPRTRLLLDERGRVLADDPRPINLRAEPDGPIITGIPIRQTFYVLEGPVCTQDGDRAYAWYKVRYERYEGWIAEGDLTSYYTEPYLPG